MRAILLAKGALPGSGAPVLLIRVRVRGMSSPLKKLVKNERRHDKKRTSQEDNIKGKQPQRKTTSQDDNLTGRQPYRSLKEDDLRRRQAHRKMTS